MNAVSFPIPSLRKHLLCERTCVTNETWQKDYLSFSVKKSSSAATTLSERTWEFPLDHKCKHRNSAERSPMVRVVSGVSQGISLWVSEIIVRTRPLGGDVNDLGLWEVKLLWAVTVAGGLGKEDSGWGVTQWLNTWITQLGGCILIPSKKSKMYRE